MQKLNAEVGETCSQELSIMFTLRLRTDHYAGPHPVHKYTHVNNVWSEYPNQHIIGNFMIELVKFG